MLGACRSTATIDPAVELGQIQGLRAGSATEIQDCRSSRQLGASRQRPRCGFPTARTLAWQGLEQFEEELPTASGRVGHVDSPEVARAEDDYVTRAAPTREPRTAGDEAKAAAAHPR